MSNVFPTNDVVVSVYGDAAGDTTNYTNDQASPITLEAINPTTGAIDATLVLPQTSSGSNSAISGEYGSTSEGTLELSGDGKSLVIAGYGINAVTYNTAEASGGPNTYGNNQLAQTTSVQGTGAGAPTAVPRVIADIRYDGTVDTSTSLYNVDNTNNPRSVATVDGSSFYLSGQGVKGDKTQGLFYVQDGASSATAINNTTDTRTVEIYNGNLYVSTDSKQGPTTNIASYSGLPTSAATPTVLPGLSNSVTLNGTNGNSINNSSGNVYLSPENYFFANATTLYVADGGDPKQGGLGDGGLQKWTYVTNPTTGTGTWTLQYTMSAGLGLVPDTATSGTTGLIGLTGKVNLDGTVSLYATNSVIGRTDPTYLYKITDPLSATTNPGTSFTVLVTAGSDTEIRGVALAPVCYVTGTLIRTARGDVAVEALAVGDLVVTASGAHRPIRWIGHRDTDCTGHPEPRKVWPVRLRSGALGAGLPYADLWLSPGHALCLDEVLIPVRCLVHGDSIRQVGTDRVTYWHVELDTHDILIANGVPSESYLDSGNRSAFDNAPDAIDLHPDFEPRYTTGFCRPYVESGPLLSAARARLFGAVVASAAEPIRMLADGVALRGMVGRHEATFLVPAGTRDLRLVSPSFDGSGDDIRRLGLNINALRIEDGTFARDVALDDPTLFAGFHEVETDGTTIWRWTDGDAHFAANLWEGLAGAFLMRIGGMFDVARKDDMARDRQAA